jgi:tetratricopeptide (TPR) repeat protein
MSEAPQEVQLSLAEFDREQLPAGQRDMQGDEFREAVREHLGAQFANERGAAEVIVTSDRIIIRWTDSTEGQSLTNMGIEHLKAGDADKGIATLRLALKRNPADHEALLNLGMALSEQGQWEESIAVMGNLLNEYPAHAPGWVALGVAQARMNRDDLAIASLKRLQSYRLAKDTPTRTSALFSPEQDVLAMPSRTCNKPWQSYPATHKRGSTTPWRLSNPETKS